MRAEWSIALAADGAAPVGLDVSQAQLRHARRRQAEHRVEFPLVAASGEATPFRDASFDLVFCDHGAMSFCDPAVSVPEVARLLRPGGRLAFCLATALVYLTYDRRRDRQSRRLRGDYFEMRCFDSRDGTVDFQVPYGEWLRAVPGQRAGRGGPRRAAPATRRDHDLHRLRATRVGPALASRGDLVAAPGALSARPGYG